MTEARAGTAKGRITYVPALDGIRAVCVLGVLCFHAGFDWARGGFLGVSTFFTLSGYLVTSILFAGLDAQRAAGVAAPRVAFLDFFRRRARRLVPASIVTLLLVVAVAPLWLGPEAQGRLGADVVASLFYVVNWRFVAGDYAYSLLFTSPSLLQHYWSLAIEGQLYVVTPMTVALAARGPDPRRVFAAIVGVLLFGGTLASFVLGADPSLHDRIYYGTDTRAPELLVGALLAVWLRPRSAASDGGARRAVDALAWLSLAVVLVAFSRIGLDGDALHRGGFALFALLSAGLIAACVHGLSISRPLAWRPLVWIGEVSYGVYLFHWPVYLALDAWLGDPAPWVKLGLGGAITFALAALSHAFVETPIRRGRGWPGRAPLAALGVAIVLVGGGIALRLPADAVVGELRGRTRDMTKVEASAEVPRIAVFGDSVALTFSAALNRWLAEREDARWVLGWAPPGCGLLMPDFIRELDENGGNISVWTRARNDGFGTRRDCLEVPDKVRKRLAEQQPDLAVSVSSMWDLLGVPNLETGVPDRVGTPRIDERLSQLMDERVELLSTYGAEVAWLTLPPSNRHDRHPMTQPEIDAARVRYNELVRELAKRHPGRLYIVDLAGAFERWPGGPHDPVLREDGIHVTIDGGIRLLDRGLGDELVELAHEARRRRRERAEVAKGR